MSEKWLISDRLTRYKSSRKVNKLVIHQCVCLYSSSVQQSKLYPVGAVGLPAAAAETQIIVLMTHLCEQHLARFKPTANTETKLSFGEKKPFSTGIKELGEPASGWETMGKDGVCMEVLVSAGDLLRHINPAWFSLSHQGCKAGALRPSTGGQMVPFGKGPQHSDLFVGVL